MTEIEPEPHKIIESVAKEFLPVSDTVPAKVLALRYRIPIALILDSVKRGQITVNEEQTALVAEYYHQLQTDGSLAESQAEVLEDTPKFVREFVKKVRASRKTSQLWKEAHKDELKEYKRNYMRPYMKNRRSSQRGKVE